MADYTAYAWVDGVTRVGPTRMNAIEAALQDAAKDSKQRGALGGRPAAASGNKNWFWVDTNNQVYYSDGSAWYALSATPTGSAGGDLTGSWPSPRVAGLFGAGYNHGTGTSGASTYTDVVTIATSGQNPGPFTTPRKRFFRTTQSDANKRSLKLFRFSHNPSNWESMYPIEVIVRTPQQSGSYTRSLIVPNVSYVPTLEVLEVVGTNAVAPTLDAGVVVSGSLSSYQVWVQIPANEPVQVEVTYGANEVAEPFTTIGQIAMDGTETSPDGAGAYYTQAGRISQRPEFGDGSDGSATLDGTATPGWATKSGSVYTMTRDCYCTDLTVNAGATLITAGCRIFATGRLTNLGTIHNNGGNGTNATTSAAGTAGAASTTTSYSAYGQGQAGAAGTSASTNGSAGTAVGLYAQGQAGGNAGASVGGGTAGAAGALTQPSGPGTTRRRLVDDIVSGTATLAGTTAPLYGGSGGGAAGGGGTGSFTGGGGGGGGIVGIFASRIINTGAIQARGGNAGNSAATSGNPGGSGGGGGGAVHIITSQTILGSGTIDANGGTGGTKIGTGTAGNAGTNGLVITIIG